jgi:hypothetical protein
MSPVTRDTNGEGDVMGCDRFQREKGEEARQLQGVRGGQHNQERCSCGGGNLCLKIEDVQRKLDQWAKCAVGPKC